MHLADFDFPFDPDLIALRPAHPRDQARLLVMDRTSGVLSHQRIADLPQWLNPGDLIVVNDTKVLPARITGHAAHTGRPVSVLFVRETEQETWEVLIKGKFRSGHVIHVNDRARLLIVERSQARTTVRITGSENIPDLMRHCGTMPLPPYIKRLPSDEDREWYQTVFAREEGAIAAPTAGLHFTPALVEALKQRGIEIATLTLHVGPGTFRPVTAEDIEEHRMEAELVHVNEQTAHMIDAARARGCKVVAVGTTVVRSLEAAACDTGRVRPFHGPTSLFITPGFTFRAVDALLTNFHLPRTTLLMLVSAYAGLEPLRKAYQEAVHARYRFYSYGDAMLIR